MSDIEYIEYPSVNYEYIRDNNVIYKVLAGGHLYGTAYNELSDYDYFSLYVNTDDFYFGLGINEKVKVNNNFESVTYYEIYNYFKLLLHNRVNFLILLWAPETNISVKHDLILPILENKNIFLSKKIYDSFLLDVNYWEQRMNTEVYQMAYDKYNQDPNDPEYQFNVKFAADMIRILSQGIEVLTDGTFTYPVPNAQEIYDIKFGITPKTKTEIMARVWDLKNDFLIAKLTSQLPVHPDYVQANTLLKNSIKGFHNII